MGTPRRPFDQTAFQDPWTSSGPVPVKRKKRERTVERSGDRIARRHGYKCYKMKISGQNGGMDKLYAKPGHHLWWEWKRPDEKPTEQQKLRHEEFRELGFDVGWSDNTTEFAVRLK